MRTFIFVNNLKTYFTFGEKTQLNVYVNHQNIALEIEATLKLLFFFIQTGRINKHKSFDYTKRQSLR